MDQNKTGNFRTRTKSLTILNQFFRAVGIVRIGIRVHLTEVFLPSGHFEPKTLLNKELTLITKRGLENNLKAHYNYLGIPGLYLIGI